MEFSANDYCDMYLVLGESGGNASMAKRLYAEYYPMRRQPSINTIRRLDERLRGNRSVIPHLKGVHPGRPRTTRTVRTEEAILEAVHANPQVSVRQLARQLGVSFKIINRVIRDERVHPYHYTKVQALLPEDYVPRMNFSRWILEKDDHFLNNILWTDEAMFTRNGVFNRHNYHYYAAENPYVTFEHGHQRRFSINIWAGIIGNNLIGPHILPNRLGGVEFLNFLQNDLENHLLDDLFLAVRRDMWIQMDGAPPHFALPVREWLNHNYENRWIGRGSPNAWPPRSPDLNPMDFFFWGYMKDRVYRTTPASLQELEQRIFDAVNHINEQMLGRIVGNLRRRADACLLAQGRVFEHFL